VLGLAVAGPIAITTVAWLFFSASEIAGHTPFSMGPPANVAEAAGLGSVSEVLRLMSAGQNPTRVWDVRPHVISSAVTRVTALEAAVWSRRAQEMEMFDRAGAIVGADTRRHLECLAADLDAEEVREYLAAGQLHDCVPNATLELIFARSRQP
jgi:hypothetical protein